MSDNLARNQVEEAVLSCLLISEGQRLNEIEISVEDYRVPLHRKLYEIMLTQHQENGRFDLLSIGLESGQSGEVSRIFNTQVSSAMLPVYVKQLRSMMMEDEVAAVRNHAAAAIKSGSDPLSVSIEVGRRLDRIRDRFGSFEKSNDLTKAVGVLFDRIEKQEPSNAVMFGFPPVDDMTNGLLGGEYAVLAARPSCGKTAFALNLMVMLAKKKIKTFFLSVEMGALSLVGRILASEAACDTRIAVRRPETIGIGEQVHLLSYREKVTELAKYIHVVSDVGNVWDNFKPMIREAVRNGAKMIFCDYLQLLQEKKRRHGDNRQNEVERISREWKGEMKRLGVPGIMLAQLSRKCEDERRYPQKADLRDSGAIEQDADLIWFLGQTYSKDKNMQPDPEDILFIQAKGRDHGTGARKLHFNRSIQTFFDYSNNSHRVEDDHSRQLWDFE